ncbi:MAG: hypothetical protein ACFFDT_05030 [Candidatus Hodarchaeota archaeon]
MLQEILQEEIIDLNLTLYAMLYFCELLLQELKFTGSEDIITEIKTIIERFHALAENQFSYHWLPQIYLLDSSLALLELDVDRSQQLLNKATTLAEEKGLQKLTIEIYREYETFTGHFSRWERIVEQKPSIEEVIELTQLGDLINRMINKRIYRKEEEIIDYAVTAKEILEKWGEN